MLIQIKLTSLTVYMVDAGELARRLKVPAAGLSDDPGSIQTLKKAVNNFL